VCLRNFLISFFILFSYLPPLGAQEGGRQEHVPRFFATNERLERPDLTRLSRLRFLTTVDFPPFNYLDSSGNLAGFHIDLIRNICLELKLTDRCQIEAVEWEQLTERLKKGQAEAVVAGLAVSATAREDLAFSRPYMRFPARFVSSLTGEISLNTVLEGDITVGLVKNTAHEKMFAAYFPDVKTQGFDDYETLTQALSEKRLLLGFGDGMRLSQWLASQNHHPSSDQLQENQPCCQFIGEAYHSVEYLGQGLRLATSRQNQSLIKAFDYALNALEKRGRLTELYLRYFPVGFY